MTTEQAFLADICANPDDDTPRLVFADWLTERDGLGDSMRAEFIRVQCRLAALDAVRPLITLPSQLDRFVNVYALLQRERQLLSQVRDCCHEEWCSWAEAVGQLPLWWHAWEFRRGFVECITLKAADWCRYAERLLATQPIREITLTTRLQIRMQVDPDPSDLYVSFHAVRLEDPAFARRPAMPWVERVPFEKPAALARWLWPGITFHGPDFPEASA
jgi:uncharacterized protein (TIGR02996 family)